MVIEMSQCSLHPWRNFGTKTSVTGKAGVLVKTTRGDVVLVFIVLNAFDVVMGNGDGAVVFNLLHPRNPRRLRRGYRIW